MLTLSESIDKFVTYIVSALVWTDEHARIFTNSPKQYSIQEK